MLMWNHAAIVTSGRTAVCVLALRSLAFAAAGSEPELPAQALLAAKSDAEKAAILAALTDEQLAALQTEIVKEAARRLPAGHAEEANHAWRHVSVLAERPDDPPAAGPVLTVQSAVCP